MQQRTVEQTLAIIKPDAFSFRLCGPVISAIENGRLSIIGAKILRLTAEQARKFYDSQKDRRHFEKLIAFMTSGPIMVLALEGNHAIGAWRKIMGASDPKKAAEGTLRKLFGSDATFNAVHGSDTPECARRELTFFFKPGEIPA
jgi:nucleoside-diphosphate kinase